jgi:hypothetical protein
MAGVVTHHEDIVRRDRVGATPKGLAVNVRDRRLSRKLAPGRCHEDIPIDKQSIATQPIFNTLSMNRIYLPSGSAAPL